MNDLLNEE